MERFQDAHKALLNHPPSAHTSRNSDPGISRGELPVLQGLQGRQLSPTPFCPSRLPPHSWGAASSKCHITTMLNSSYFQKYLFEKLGEES